MSDAWLNSGYFGNIQIMSNSRDLASFPGLHPAFVACSTKSGEGLEYLKVSDVEGREKVERT